MNKAKRSLVAEIKEVRSRTEFNSRVDFSSKLNDIQYAFDEIVRNNGDYDDELIKYIPIATVACFEAFFRSAYKELIDFGAPYSDNAVKFNQNRNIRFDFEVINAVQDKAVSVGEFVSHLLPCNNFNDINSNFSTILGKDFAQGLRDFITDLRELESGTEIQFSALISDIKRIFELRHIFCHEFATNLKIDKDEILRCFNNSRSFLELTNDYLWDVIYPDAPETQAEMNDLARKTFENQESKLDVLIYDIVQTNKDQVYMMHEEKAFLNVMDKWKEYREFKAKTDAAPYESGSMYSTIYFNSLASSTEEKIESLTKEFEISLRKHIKRIQ